MVTLFDRTFLPFLIVSFLAFGCNDKKYDTLLLNEETEKLICLIHLFNKRVSHVEHHSLQLKEEFQKHYGALQSILTDFTAIKAKLAETQSALPKAMIQDYAVSFKFLYRIGQIPVTPLALRASSIVYGLSETLDRIIALEEFTAKSAYYKRLYVEPHTLATLKEMRNHLSFLHTHLASSATKSISFPATFTEEKILLLLTSSPAKFVSLIDRTNLIFCALHTIILSQMEHVYNLQHSIALFEKEPTSIIDDIHEKTITLKNKLSKAQQLFAKTLKALISLVHNSSNLINNGLALLQSAHTALGLPFAYQKEIENEMEHLSDSLTLFKNKGSTDTISF